MQRTRRKSDISSAGTVKLRTTKRTPPSDAVIRRASMPSMPLDKVDMLIMEANEITQYLQKDYVSCLVFTCFSSLRNIHVTFVLRISRPLETELEWDI